MSTSKICISCRLPKANRTCQLCEAPVCKNCVQILEEPAFAFLKTRAPELSHTYYCAPCFDQSVGPAQAAYEETLERARGIFFFFLSQKKQAPLIRSSKLKLRAECDDRDEVILRLGFQSAELGFNAVIGGEVTSQKIRDASGYQRSVWVGLGIPADVDAEKLARQEEREGVY